MNGDGGRLRPAAVCIRFRGDQSEAQAAPPGARQNLEIPQQPLDVVELELRAEVLAEAPAQFFQNAARALHVDFARHLDRGVIAVLTPAQGSPERIGLLLGARRPEPAGLSVRAGTQHALLLHRLGEVLRAAAQSFERAALGIDRPVRVAFSKLTFRLALFGAHPVAAASQVASKSGGNVLSRRLLNIEELTSRINLQENMPSIWC